MEKGSCFVVAAHDYCLAFFAIFGMYSVDSQNPVPLLLLDRCSRTNRGKKCAREVLAPALHKIAGAISVNVRVGRHSLE